MSIELKNVTHIYKEKTPFARVALKNISLVIEEGSFTSIAGHTGSGKSTLLEHLNGILQPTTGSVLVDGIDLSLKGKEGKIAKKARQKVGMVFQYPEHQLFEETVEKDIAFAPKNLGITGKELEDRVRYAMDFVNLDYKTYKDRSPFHLSGGQMRRVAIAGVLAMKTKYLVLDEPTAGVDPKGKKDLLERIVRLHRKENVTIIFVSHSMEDIARLSNRVIFMHEGEVLLNAPPKKAFLEKDILQKAHLSTPEIVSLLEKLNAKGLNINSNVFTVEEAVQNIEQAIFKGEKRSAN